MLRIPLPAALVEQARAYASGEIRRYAWTRMGKVGAVTQIQPGVYLALSHCDDGSRNRRLPQHGLVLLRREAALGHLCEL